MVNNFARDNIARLTFGNLDSEISSGENPSSEISLAFTPTTLALIERNYLEFGDSVAMPKQTEGNSIPGAWDHSASYSGLSEYSDDSNDASFCAEWTAGQKQMKLCDNSVSTTEAAGDARPARRLPGPRPSCRDEEMPEDLERRKRRRQRNKHAAAKCCQRRVDQTNELLEETKSLEQESQKLEKEIETLERLKHQLEFVLEAHKPSCKADVVVSQYPVLKVEPCGSTVPTSSHPAQRPTSLSIAATTLSAGMPVSTSASQLSFDFPLTGLTPLGDPAALFASLDGTSPSAILLSPSSLLI